MMNKFHVILGIINLFIGVFNITMYILNNAWYSSVGILNLCCGPIILYVGLKDNRKEFKLETILSVTTGCCFARQ